MLIVALKRKRRNHRPQTNPWHGRFGSWRLSFAVSTIRGSSGVGVRGSGHPPLKNHKNIGFLLSNTGQDPLKITKLPSQHSMLDQHGFVAFISDIFAWSVIVAFPDQMNCCIFLFGLDVQRKIYPIPMQHRCNHLACITVSIIDDK